MYIQTTSALLIVSGFCVYSVASALFMFPIMHTYYSQALTVSLIINYIICLCLFTIFMHSIYGNGMDKDCKNNANTDILDYTVTKVYIAICYIIVT